MICKNCGTQCTGAYCSHCGHKMESDVYPNTAKPAAEVTVKPMPEASTSVATKKKAKKSKKARGSRRPLRLKMVFWQAILMLAPLAYFFIDLFVVFHEKLGEVAEKGKTNLALLFEYLSLPEYSDNTFEEIAHALLGDITLFETFSLRSFLTGDVAAEFTLPLLAIALFALLSAAMAVLLIVTGGRILHIRLAVDLCLLGGIGATFAPFIGSLLLRISYCIGAGPAAADAAMLCVTPSIESLLMMAFLACAMLPAMRSIARLGAYAKRQEHHVVFPYRIATRFPFRLTKALAGATIACSLALVVSYLFLPISSEGDLLAFSHAWKSFSADLTALCKSIWGIIAGAGKTPDFAALASTLIKFFFFLQIPLLVAGFVAVLATFIRIWRMRAETLCDRMNDRRRLAKIGTRIRDIVLKPYVCFTVLQTLLFFVLLLISPMATRLNFADIPNTLGAIYLTVAEVKSFCTTTTVYTFLALGGALLWHTAGKLSKVLVIKADEK